ncbi:hypothetical protein [Streptomyces cuspidosporus]|uniref:Secreted protein n=1 Tax=Streptomyces cuspidosporus TaxID=66882 RepID=A0ABP5SAI2_9ACTN
MSFFALAAYVAFDAVRALVCAGEADRSIPGIVIAAIAVKEGRDAWLSNGCCATPAAAEVPSAGTGTDVCGCRPGCDCCG